MARFKNLLDLALDLQERGGDVFLAGGLLLLSMMILLGHPLHQGPLSIDQVRLGVLVEEGTIGKHLLLFHFDYYSDLHLGY
jgi:hypothetical protein